MLFKTKKSKNIVFIIGSGRSGTHLLGRTIGLVERYDSFIENKESFNFVTKIAVNPKRNPKDIKKVLKLYERIFKKSKNQYILEKTHPNIWLVEDLLEHFSNSKFIGIKRDVYATVASMLKHKGVLNWYNVLPLNEVNPFLGITTENIEIFKELPIEMKCALRWKSHVNRLDDLQAKFPKEVLVVNYEDFYKDYSKLMKGMASFLDLENPIISETLNSDSLEKWKLSLSKEQIINIDKVLQDNYG